MMAKEEVEDREHTELSASWSKIWLHCTEATRLSKLFPSVEDNEDYTIEGTQAHYLGELLLEGVITKEQLPSEFFDLEFYYDKTMEIVANGTLLVEVKVDMTEMLEVPEGLGPIYGRSDFVALHKDGSIDIGDLKFGKGLRVDAYDNEQLKLYAIGTLQSLDDIGVIDLNTLADDTRITLHIIQPRLDINYSYYNMTYGQLKEFTDFVKGQLKKIKAGDLEYDKGDRCQFCKGKTFCPKFQEAVDLAVVEAPKDIVTIDQDKLIKLYQMKADVMAFYRALDKYVKANITLSENGEFFGHKIIIKEGNREVVDEEALIAQFVAAGCPVAELQDVSIVGMTKLDKIAKKYGIAKDEIAGVAKKQTETVVSVVDERDKLFGGE